MIGISREEYLNKLLNLLDSEEVKIITFNKCSYDVLFLDNN